jgi:4-hydroxy-3-methylbut-2-enyl diphosphate reductase
MDTHGKQFVEWDELKADDIVIIPAFGTTVEIMKLLSEKGIQVEKYNTTCPFVEKVWKRSDQLGKDDFSVIIHGKIKHEETRATFSHSYQGAPSVVILNMEEAKVLGQFVRKERPANEFYQVFAGKYSEGFDAEKDLDRVGVVNQTTMLATETQGIADFFKQTMIDLFGEAEYKKHFADTRDTLCYATNDNQRATIGVLEEGADLAIVVGGYNSSNTSHIAELCEEKMPTFFINSDSEISSKNEIHHFNYPEKRKEVSANWMEGRNPLRIILTSGASCPDATVDAVMQKILTFFNDTRNVDEVIEEALAKP